MKEFKLDAAATQRLIEGCDDDVAHPRCHLPEYRALVLEKHQADQENHQTGCDSWTFGASGVVAEYQVVHASDKWEVKHVRMTAMAQDPLTEILVIDGSEAGQVGDQLVGDDAADDRCDQRYQQPCAFTIGSVFLVDRVTDVQESVVK